LLIGLRAAGLACEINALQCDSAAVPPGFTTFAIASVMISQFLGR